MENKAQKIEHVVIALSSVFITILTVISFHSVARIRELNAEVAGMKAEMATSTKIMNVVGNEVITQGAAWNILIGGWTDKDQKAFREAVNAALQQK